MNLRTGIGFDAHPFVPGRPLCLGGVEISHTAGLKGHSDGDALLHAIADAILGAAGLASLGEHFPDDAADLEGARSGPLLARVSDVARRSGFEIEDLIEVQAPEGATTRFAYHSPEWARQWPSEEIWKARRRRA